MDANRRGFSRRVFSRPVNQSPRRAAPESGQTVSDWPRRFLALWRA